MDSATQPHSAASFGVVQPLEAAGPPETAARRVVRIAAQLLRAPAAALVSTAPETLLAETGLSPVFRVPAAILEDLRRHATPLALADLRKDARFRDEDVVLSQGMAACLAGPVLSARGEVRGVLCVFDKKPRKWSAADETALADVAALVARDFERERNVRHAAARDGAGDGDFRALANSLPVLCWMAEADGSIYWYNQRFYDYTGLTRDKPGNLAVHPDHYERIASKYRQAAAAGEAWEDTIPLRGLDGEYRWFLSRALPRRDTSGKIVGWFGANIDITERLEAEERQTLLMREIDHRAKNALAVVQAVVRLSRADDAEDFRTAVEGRVAALARSHALLAQKRWEGADLRQLLADELAPYITKDPSRATLTGPSHLLLPETAQTMALVLHELATNAAKHGALAQAGGMLGVTWEILSDGGLSLEWRETLQVAAPKPKRVGFGTSLFAQSIERHLGGVYEMDMRASGLVCRMRLPARPSVAGENKREDRETTPMAQKKILLVEDDALIAMEMEERLADMGYAVLGPAATIEAAEQAIAKEKPDVALLDANLRGRTTVELGVALVAQGVPVAFCTGYEEVKGLPPHMASTPVLTKPIMDEDLAATLKKLLSE